MTKGALTLRKALEIREDEITDLKRQIADLQERLEAWRMLLHGGYAVAVYTETGPERIDFLELIPPDVIKRLKEKGEWPT